MIEHLYELAFFGITVYLLYAYLCPALVKQIKSYERKRNKIIQDKTVELENNYADFQKAKSTYDSSLKLYRELPKSLEKIRETEIKATLLKQKEQVEKYIELKKNQIRAEILNDKKHLIYEMFANTKNQLNDSSALPLHMTRTLEVIKDHFQEEKN